MIPESELITKLKRVRAVIFDVDGVLTNGGLIVGPKGEEYKRFNSRDGHGLRMLQNSGVTIAVITGRTSNVVAHRCAELGIEHLYQGCRDKRPAFESLTQTLGFSAAEFAYMGDDVIDLPVMRKVGVAMCVADGHTFVKQHSHWVSNFDGGSGAVRDACELIMRAHGTLNDILNSYLD
ncbi:MAG: HAD family hydrolase [Pseudomonadota bacterium]